MTKVTMMITGTNRYDTKVAWIMDHDYYTKTEIESRIFIDKINGENVWEIVETEMPATVVAALERTVNENYVTF